MISGDVRIEGFDSRSWTNLLSLFAPGVVRRIHREPIMSDAPEVEHESPTDGGILGTLIIVVSSEGKVLKAFHTTHGRIRNIEYTNPSQLAALSAQYGARRAFVLRKGILEEVAERVAQRTERGDDYIAQWLVVARTLREAIDSGGVHMWPRPFGQVPIPTAGMIRRAIDTVFPDDRSIVLVVWKGATPWTAVVLRRQHGEIDLVAGPDLIARWSGPLGGDWRRDHRVISDAIANSVAPLHLGIYGEIESIRRLLRSAEPGAWAKAVAVREIIVSPTPPYVAVAVGADAARAAAQRTAEWLGGIDALSNFAPAAQYLRGRVSEIASVTQTLGFDPLKVLATVITRNDDAPASGAYDEQDPADQGV